MAKTVSVIITDDPDGTPGTETMAFSWRGTAYERGLAARRTAKATGQPSGAARAVPGRVTGRPC